MKIALHGRDHPSSHRATSQVHRREDTKGAPLFVATWSDGLLVEAEIAVAETIGNCLVAGEGQILFVSDLSEKEEQTS